VGRRKAAGAAMFNGGGVAPVVVDVRGGVLQHRCGRGKERFSSNSGNGEARRALTGKGEDSGDARQNPT
jgi:hypothetical protein